MKRIEEFAYYKWLEDEIRNFKRTGFYFQNNNDEKDMDILIIAEHIVRKNPEILKDVFAGAVNGEKINKDELFTLLKKSEKGTIVTWKDKTGEEFIFVNSGTRMNKKRILVLGEDFQIKLSDLKFLKESIAREIIKKDVKFIYEKIAVKEKAREKKATVTGILKDDTINNNAGSFEKNFKSIIKKYGAGMSAMATACFMIKTMPASEKKNLQNSLSALGVKSSEDLNNLLAKWKKEALTPEVKRTRHLHKNNMGIGIEI